MLKTSCWLSERTLYQVDYPSVTPFWAELWLLLLALQQSLELALVVQHWDACNKVDTWKFAIAEHQWDQQHEVDWDATRVLDMAARPVQLKVKEALHTKRTPANNRLNRDGGYELLGCWIATMKKLGG